MSSFMVSNNCMNRAVSGCMLIIGDLEHRAFVGRFPVMAKIIGKKYQTGKDLTEAFADMNAQAVHARYPNEPPDFEPYEFTPISVRDFQSAVAAVKGIHCLSYQCAEDGVYGSDLWLELEDMGDMLSAYAIRHSEAYHDASWG